VRRELEFTLLAGHVDLFHARYEGSMALPELARRCWDLDSLKAAYESFMQNVQRHLRDAPPQGKGAFTAVVTTSNAWRRLNFRDPLLPLSALPDDWPRPEASRLHDELVERFLAPAQAYVASLD
jgi:phenylacetic acid degradation operon negative regulatory protein